MATRAYATSKDGVKIRYEVRGQGAPLALIMGFSGSMKGWGEPFVNPLEKKFKTILIDNRGTGESDKPERPFTLTDMAADAVAVLDHLGIARAHVYGISMGGMIAQEFALNFAGRLSALVLGCTNCGMAHSVQAPQENVAALVPDPALTPEQQARRAFSVACGKAFVNSARGKAVIDEAIAQIGSYPITPMHTYQLQMQAIMGFSSFDRLGEIKAPTLVIHGDDDNIVPVKNADILHEHIAGSRRHIIKTAGHMFFWEFPEDAANTAAAFMSELK